MTSSCVLLVLLVVALLVSSPGDCVNDTTAVYLVNVLPFPDGRSFSGWDRAYELIPASELAVEQINNRSDILPGYELKIINVDSEACGISVVSRGLTNTYVNFVDEDMLIGGVVGLFCSTVTEVLSPLSSPEFPFLDYVHVAGSTSVKHRSSISDYPRLYHTISSTAIFNAAVLKMMEKFDWNKMGLVYNSASISFIASATDFNDKISAAPNMTLSTSFPVSRDNNIVQLFGILRNGQARTVFVALTAPQAAVVLCRAYQEELSSGLVLILQELTVDELLRSTEEEEKITCTREEMIEAMEGMFLLTYRLEVELSEELVSQQSYSDYYKEYVERLSALEEEIGMQLNPNNSYANVAYDEVWTLALALNNSIVELSESNLTLEKYREIEKRSQITGIIQSNVDSLSFQGAAGFVKFTAQRETNSSIYIYRVTNGTASKVAIYNAVDGLIQLLQVFDVPDDEFDTVYNVLPAWLEYTSYVVFFVIEISVIFVAILHLIYRNRPEVKATSRSLTMVMFVGCFVVTQATIFRTLSRVLFNLDASAYKVICNFEVWSGSTGLNLILGTLLVRLLRIWHVFKTTGRTSKYWSDRYLFIGILGLCSGAIVIISIWTAVDPIRMFRDVRYIPDAIPPHYEVTLRCSSDNLTVWLLVAFAYSGFLLNAVLFLAIKTRHVKKTNFKDTKKVNAYLFAITFATAILLPLWSILEYGVESRIGAHIAITLMFLSASTLCLALIFVPKVIPLLPCFPERLRRKSMRAYNMKATSTSAEILTSININCKVTQV